MGVVYVKLNFPCGYKMEIYTKRFGIWLKTYNEEVCPLHKMKCYKGAKAK